MEIISQTLFTTLLDFCLNHWRLETMIILIIILAVYLIRHYKIKLTKLEISLGFICLFLIYCNLFCINIYNQQQQIIKEYQTVIQSYNEKIDLVYDNIRITRIIMETQTKANPKEELIKALEKYFEEQHKI